LSAWKKPANLYSTKCRIFGPPPPRAQHRGGTPLPDGLFSTPSNTAGLPELASPKLQPPLHQNIFFNKLKKIFFFYVWDRISPITLNKIYIKIIKIKINTKLWNITISWHNPDFTDFSTKPKSARMPVYSKTVLLSKCFFKFR
jgi:hypothetical protein